SSVLQNVRWHAPDQSRGFGAHLPEHSSVPGNVGIGKPVGGPAYVGQSQPGGGDSQYQGLPQSRKRRAGPCILLAGSGGPGGLCQPFGRGTVLRSTTASGNRPGHVHTAADHLPGRTGCRSQPAGNRSPEQDDSVTA